MVHDVDLEAYLSGAWTDVPLMATAVKVTRGLDPYGTWPRPAKFECEIDNDTLHYDPSRPQSLLYGIAGRNTKVRIKPRGSTYLWAEASSWRPERTPDHQSGLRRGRSSTQLTAEGILRRIGTWSDPLRSPMYRTISARTTSIGHWSLEDDQDSRVLANSLSTGTSGTFKGGATIADSEAPLGAQQTVKVATGSQLAGIFGDASSTAGWQVSWSFKMPALPGSATYGRLLRWTTSNGYTWLAEVNNTTYQFSVNDPDGTSLLSSAVAFGTGYEPNQWITMRVKSSVSGGTVTVEPAWYAQGDTVEVGSTSTFSGTVGALRQWWQDGDAVNTGSWFSHVFGVTTTADSLVGAAAQEVFNGYSGEAALTRFYRLCSELGIARYGIGNESDSMTMGPQSAATFLELLKEIRDTEDGRIDDERFDIALTMRTRRALYNQTAALALTYPQDIYAYDKEIGDLNTHNQVTVKNTAGGDTTVSRTTGTMSTQAPPNGVGLNPATVNVNVDDANDLDDIGHWHLAKGTLELPLYGEVTLNLTASSALVSGAIAVREGDYITVTGLEAETIRLLVVGIVRDTTPGVETITFQCEPYDPYLIGIWDDASFRYDSASTTLASSATSTATSLSLTSTDANDVWSTTAVPYALLIGGERVTATAMTAAAGTGPYTQTATVTRSANGVVKAQTSGTTVHLADPRRWGL